MTNKEIHGARVLFLLSVSALSWSLIGAMLMARGLNKLLTPGLEVVMVSALCLGTVKSFFVLDRIARKNIQHVLHLDERAGIHRIYSGGTWILIGVMVVTGRLLRYSSLPDSIVGFVFLAIGWGLFLSSRVVWREWYGGRALKDRVVPPPQFP